MNDMLSGGLGLGMIIERFLQSEELRKYRVFKADLKAWVWQRRHLWKRLRDDGSLKRLSDREFAPVFICGIAGSGTTLITALLDQSYENSLCLRESARLPETDRLLWLNKTYEYHDLDQYRDALNFPKGISVARVRRAVLSTYRRLVEYPRANSVVIDKAPNAHMVRIGKLSEAFPNAKVVMIYRDPLDVIEGLIRKWPQPFAMASLDALCAFYNEIHWEFIEQSQQIENRLILELDTLKANSEAITREIAAWLGLEERKEIKVYRDRNNTVGKGLRNVVDGKVYVDTKTASRVNERFSAQEQKLIRDLTQEMYKTLQSLESLSINTKNECIPQHA